MRLATVAVEGGGTRAAVQSDDTWLALPASDLSELLAGPDWREVARSRPGHQLPDARPLTPVARPAKVICCGLNYADHIRETGRELPTHPTLFAKFADTLTDPGAVIEAPDDAELDWEAELAVVVGTELRRADDETAQRAIAGYTVANDLSVRSWQRRTLQWLQGKAWDATTPVGPVVVTPDEVDPADGLEITCEVNGEVVQRANTGTLVFGPAALLAYVSQFTTLRPGDLVLTGTPGGVGMAASPPRYLHDGDLVRCRIEGVGLLENTIRLTPTSEEDR